MALVHTLVLKPRLVLAEALRRFARHPLPLTVTGLVSLLPDLLRKHPFPSDLESWQLYLANPPSAQELQAQMTYEGVTDAMGFALTVLAWPILTLITQGVAVPDLMRLGVPRLLAAARAFALAVLSLFGFTVLLLMPSLVAFVVTHQRGEPWLALPGIEAMGFWLVVLADGFAALLVVSLVGGALLVVPAEACAHPAPARTVVERSWRMCRDHLGGAAWLLAWLFMFTWLVGTVNSLLESAGVVGRVLSYVGQAALASIPALAGAALHATLSEHQEALAANQPSAAGTGVGSVSG